MNLRIAALTTVCGIATLSFAACGGGGSSAKAVDAEDWVNDVCDLAIDFQDEGDAIFSDLDDVEPTDRDAKDRFLEVFEAIREEHAALIDEFEKLGYPDVDRGEQIRDAFRDNLDQNQEALATLIEDVEDLSASEFADEVGLLLDEIDDPDLLAALERVRGDADLVIELIEEDADCASILFDNQQGDTGDDDDGAPDTREVEEWTLALCDAFLVWQDDLDFLATQLEFSETSEPQEIKTALVTFFVDVVDRSEGFQLEVDGLGAPDIDDGPEIQAAITAAVGEVVAIFRQGLSEAEELDATDEVALNDGIFALGDRLEEAATEVADLFGQIELDYDTTAIDEAAAALPECEGFWEG